MQDVLIRKSGGNNFYEIQVENGDIQSVDGLESTIVVSLFTDARAPENIVSDAIRRRGWVGNILNENLQEIGSLLWLLDQSRLTTLDINEARIHALNSLQILIDRNIVNGISVEVSKTEIDVLIKITFSDLENIIDEYITLWRVTSGSNLSEF